MTAVAHGPYEHVGAYADLAVSEVFDTSGAPGDFCPSCDHAPCVAGALKYCEQPPRFIVVQSVEEEIRDLAVETIHGPRQLESGLRLAMWTGARGLTWVAWNRDMAGDSALRQLAIVRQYLRQAKEALS